MVQKSKKALKKVSIEEFEDHHFFDMASLLIVLLTALIRMTARSDLHLGGKNGRAYTLDRVVLGLVEELRFVVGEGFPGTTHD